MSSKDSDRMYGAAIVAVLIVILVVLFHRSSLFEGMFDKIKSDSGYSERDVDKYVSEKFDGAYDPASVGVDPEIYGSHKQFVDEAYQGTNNTSLGTAETLRDDTNDVNPQIGLRRIDYSKAFSQDDARTVSSESPDQMVRSVGKYTI